MVTAVVTDGTNTHTHTQTHKHTHTETHTHMQFVHMHYLRFHLALSYFEGSGECPDLGVEIPLDSGLLLSI